MVPSQLATSPEPSTQTRNNLTLAGKICAVTGANRGIGFEVAHNLATMGAEVYLLCRNKERGVRAAKAIATITKNDRVRWMELDLSLQSSIRSFARLFASEHNHLDILINNAATATPDERTFTSEGVETIFATNVVGPYLLTKLLAPLLQRTPGPPARVVFMSSLYAGRLDLNDLFFMRRRFDNHTAYRQTKQAVRMIARYLATSDLYFGSSAQPEGTSSAVKVICNSCMPGLIQTKLLKDLGLSGGQLPTKGAKAPTSLAVDEELAEKRITGRFFVDGKPIVDRFADDAHAVAMLVRKCESLLVHTDAFGQTNLESNKKKPD